MKGFGNSAAPEIDYLNRTDNGGTIYTQGLGAEGCRHTPMSFFVPLLEYNHTHLTPQRQSDHSQRRAPLFQA